MIVITVHDEVGNTWSNPGVVSNEQAAIRDFRSACSDTRSLIGQHPTDFKLYAIGEWIVSLDPSTLPTFRAFKDFKFLYQGEVKNGQDA